MKSKIRKYYKQIIEYEKNFSPDYIFFISPETATKECILFMKAKWPHAKFILYMYDSIKNKNAKYIYKSFDKCLSFDPNDCNNYGFIFRPLFFLNDFENNDEVISYDYDFCFIGSIHSDRAKILYKLKEEFEKNNLTYFYYLYFPGKLMLFTRKLLDSWVRKFPKELLHTIPIDKKTVADVSKKTRCIIDINHPKQTGLTMRTIEMIGLNKKILTTNSNIKKYDFYVPENQIIINREKIKVDELQLKKKYKKIDSEIYDNYKISKWVSNIFEGEI